MNAFTASSCSIIAVEKIVGLAPLVPQEVRDRLVADVRCRIDARYPIAEPPIDRGARHRRLLLDQNTAYPSSPNTAANAIRGAHHGCLIG